MSAASGEGPGPLRVIKAALLIGASLMVGMALAAPALFESAPTELHTPDASLVTMLSAVHAVVFGVAVLVALTVPPRMPANTPEQRVMRRLVRWAALEFTALFGAVVVLLAGMEGLVPEEPLYYLNLASYVVFAFILFNDPVSE